MTPPERAEPAEPTREASPTRVRLAGWSPGTSTLVGAWIASAAIARLTGATAVILLLAAAFVSLIFEVVAGWWLMRAVRVGSVVATRLVTVGEPCRVMVTLESAPSRHTIERLQLGLRLADGTAVRVEPTASATPPTPFASDGTAIVIARFEAPGVIRRLTVRLEVAGPAGLVWWRRTTDVTVDDVHVAAIAGAPMLAVESVTATSEGSAEALRGNHDGEIDGVRPWRAGDSTSSVHWASSMRSNELIVHDRLASADRRWIVDAGAVGVDAGRLRWTLDEARRRGHPVAIRTADGSLHPVADGDAAARWSAITAQAHADASADGPDQVARHGLLRREIRAPRIERDRTITLLPRWSAAAAAGASMAMLIGALDGSAGLLAVVLCAIALGAAATPWLARRSGRRPLWMQAMFVAALAVAVAAIGVQAVDIDGLLGALRGPLPNVLMLLVVLHGFEVIDRRSLRVHLAITFVLASYGAGLRIDAALGWWLAAWGVPFVIAALTTARRAVSPIDQPLVAQPVASRGVAESVRSTRRWAGSVVVVGAATLAALSIVPIPDGPARLGLPALSLNAPNVSNPGGLAGPDGSDAPTGDANERPDRGSIGGVVGYPGFTETLDTSVRGDLGDDIVMRVRAPEPAFWRGQTFTEFDGRTWTVSPELGRPRSGPMIAVPPTVGDALGSAVPSRQLVQTYFVETDLPNIVFAAYRADRVIFDGPVWTRPDGALRSDVTLTAGSVYTVLSERQLVDADILRAQGDLGAFFAGFADVAGRDEIAPFLELPASTSQRTIDLATQLRTPGESTYDTILAYEAWLGANTEYDLDAPVPADGADAVDDFLFESRRGFCEQIASTLTIMLRSQGVPARLATGYVPGERDRVSGVWNVRSSDAHAWVEVWFPQTGWQAFDPTAEVPLAADAAGGTVGGDLIGATLSSVSSRRVEMVLVAGAVASAWVLTRLVVAARHRRRRGRWGLLQDRYTRLSGPSVLPGPGPGRTVRATNPEIAASIVDDDRRAAALAVAGELDRAAFDPSWSDDDGEFERTRSALDTLERARR
jgi:transglutaminase-like putative cysteine protease